jgi:hypothetical protein
MYNTRKLKLTLYCDMAPNIKVLCFFRNVGTDYSVAQWLIPEEWKNHPHLCKNLKTRTLKSLKKFLIHRIPHRCLIIIIGVIYLLYTYIYIYNTTKPADNGNTRDRKLFLCRQVQFSMSPRHLKFECSGLRFRLKTGLKQSSPILLQSFRASHCESPEFELYVRKQAIMAFLTFFIRMNLQYITIWNNIMSSPRYLLIHHLESSNALQPKHFI